MSKSLLSNDHECFVCHTTHNLERHHIYNGIGRRSNAEKYGCWVYLCHYHHQNPSIGVHGDGRTIDRKLKQYCQKKFEETHTRDEFRRYFGISYLGDE